MTFWLFLLDDYWLFLLDAERRFQLAANTAVGFCTMGHGKAAFFVTQERF